MARSRNSQTEFVTAIVAGTNSVIATARPGYRIVVTSATQSIQGGIGHFATIALSGTPVWTVSRTPPSPNAGAKVQSAPERDTPVFVLAPGAGLLFNYTLGQVGTLADAGATLHYERAL